MPGLREAYERARPGAWVIGWKLDASQRDELLARFPPRFGRVVAHHVTLRPFVAADSPLPDPVQAQLVGEACDGEGVQAFVVAIDGSTARPDGGTWHVTWSLAPGRKAKESNDVIARGWTALDAPVALRLAPASFR